jgi:basic amino acid/polyamine antiporter, APA family
LIMISTFGCNNGIILASARLYQAMAIDGLFFKKMQHNNKFGVPGFALWIQFAWTSVLCLMGKYNDLLDYIMFVVMAFYVLTTVGIFILRKKRPAAERPYRAFGYPVLPIIFILLSTAFCIDVIYMQPKNALFGLGIVLLGIPIFYYWNSKRVQA